MSSNNVKNIVPARSALLMFAVTLFIGLAIFLIFGQLAGAFAGDKGLINALTDSVYGYIALFGATMMLAAPFIGLTIWALDRSIKSTLEKNKK